MTILVILTILPALPGYWNSWGVVEGSFFLIFGKELLDITVVGELVVTILVILSILAALLGRSDSLGAGAAWQDFLGEH